MLFNHIFSTFFRCKQVTEIYDFLCSVFYDFPAVMLLFLEGASTLAVLGMLE